MRSQEYTSQFFINHEQILRDLFDEIEKDFTITYTIGQGNEAGNGVQTFTGVVLEKDPEKLQLTVNTENSDQGIIVDIKDVVSIFSKETGNTNER